MMRKTTLLLCAALPLLISGGCSLISMQKFGPEEVNGTTLNEVVKNNGSPDLIGGSDDYIVLGYTRVEGVQVLGIFGRVKKTKTAVVCDRTGNVISKGESEPGHAVTIIGGWTSPVGVIED